VWRVLILSSLLLAAQGACGGAPRPAAGPTHTDGQVADIDELATELRHLQRDECPRGDEGAYIEAICDNGEETCRIADDLGDHAWAKEKCATARRACRSAQTACYGVSARPQIF
jgi:hypothetical protein